MEEIIEYVKNKKEKIKNIVKNIPFSKPLKIVIVQVNDDAASNSYIKGKINDLTELNIPYQHLKLRNDIDEKSLLEVVDRLNKDNSVTGFIVQLPLPKGINEEKIKRSIDPKKDIDGFNPLSPFLSATPKGILEYLIDNNYEFNGKNAVILGRSEIVGKPMAHALLKKNMNVIVLHSYTSNEDRKFYIEHADLIIVAIGKPYFIKNNDYKFKENTVIFDVGISRVEGKLRGDCEPGLKCLFQSPVPKGVGLLTRLALILNLLEAYNYGF